ncbi:MAG: DNA repair protein RecN [Actinomycetaceae bacterium]|nr:DNA repair protein RecN [Actinomycetaceae bacterium]MDY6083247.1 DNA repair protein RecN [Actinomycetaceae bacterium]
MIDSLDIHHLGVIDEAHLNLGPGLTVVTGETGAGKTMAVSSFLLLQGRKADAAKVRYGTDEAQVQASFVVPKDAALLQRVADAGGVWDEDHDQAWLEVSRRIPARGHSRAFLGGARVPAATLEQVVGDLLTIHGQSEQMRLASSSAQRDAVDAAGGTRTRRALRDYVQRLQEYRDAREALENFDATIREQARFRLAWQALVAKVDAVNPTLGEEDDLRAQSQDLESAESRFEAFSSAASRLAGEQASSSVSDTIRQAVHDLHKVLDDTDETGTDGSATAHQLNELVERLSAAALEIDDIASEISQLANQTGANPQQLEDIYARRQQLRTLTREVGMSVDEAIAQADEARTQLASLQDPEQEQARLQDTVRTAQELLTRSASELHAARVDAAQSLENAINSELPHLALGDARISIVVNSSETFGSHGQDTVEFLFQANSGLQSHALAQTASGGELSRIMLAVELALSDTDSDVTFLFDEVDAGVGGVAARALGERLKRLSSHAQVIVVTHVAQIAALADHHFVVRKHREGGTTTTAVHELTFDERLPELARMLSGSDTDVARAHAAELLRGENMAR